MREAFLQLHPAAPVVYSVLWVCTFVFLGALACLLLWPRASVLWRVIKYSGLGIVAGFLGVVVIGAITR
jgi:hypothetical protein